MKIPSEIKDSKRYLNNQIQKTLDDKHVQQNLKDVALEIIEDALDTFTKINIQLEKSEKYSLKLWSLNTPTDIVLTLKKFVSEVLSGFKNYINNLTNNLSTENIEKFKSSNLETTISEEDYQKLEKEQQKYEQKVRDQIRIEQQQKLHTESLQTKLDDNMKVEEDLQNVLSQRLEGLQSDLLREKDHNQSLVKENIDLANKFQNDIIQKDLEILTEYKSENDSNFKIEENSPIANSNLIQQPEILNENVNSTISERAKGIKMPVFLDISICNEEDKNTLQNEAEKNIQAMEIYSDSNEIRDSQNINQNREIQDINVLTLQKNLSSEKTVELLKEPSLRSENSIKLTIPTKKPTSSNKQAIPSNKSVYNLNESKTKGNSHNFNKTNQNEKQKGSTNQANINRSVPKNIGSSLNYNLLQNNEKRGISMNNQLQNSKQKIIQSSHKNINSKNVSSTIHQNNNESYNAKLQKIFIKANFAKTSQQENNSNVIDDYNFSKKKEVHNKPTPVVKKNNPVITNNNVSHGSQIFDEAPQNLPKSNNEFTKTGIQRASLKKGTDFKDSNSLRNSIMKKEVNSNSLIKKREETSRVTKNQNANLTTNKKDTQKINNDSTAIVAPVVQSNSKQSSVQKYFNQYSSNSNLVNNTKSGLKCNNVIGCLSSNTATSYKTGLNQHSHADSKKKAGVKQYQALSQVRTTYLGSQASLQKNFVAGENIGNLKDLAILQSYSGSVGSNTKEKILKRPSTNYTKKSVIKHNNGTNSFDNSK